MQIVIHVACYKGRSLRALIGADTRLRKFGLRVTEQKRMGRSTGWSKIHSENQQYGAINIQWDSAGSVLLCREVTRGGDPGPLLGDFLKYLISQYRSRIQAIHIVPVRAN
jgi:hypothetical protein